MSKITGFHQDAEGDWVAELACGHAQHVRHRPPWQNRVWTTSAAGRAEKIGTDLSCPRCRDVVAPCDPHAPVEGFEITTPRDGADSQ